MSILTTHGYKNYDTITTVIFKENHSNCMFQTCCKRTHLSSFLHKRNVTKLIPSAKMQLHHQTLEFV